MGKTKLQKLVKPRMLFERDVLSVCPFLIKGRRKHIHQERDLTLEQARMRRKENRQAAGKNPDAWRLTPKEKIGNMKVAIKWSAVDVNTLNKIGGCPIHGEPRQFEIKIYNDVEVNRAKNEKE